VPMLTMQFRKFAVIGSVATVSLACYAVALLLIERPEVVVTSTAYPPPTSAVTTQAAKVDDGAASGAFQGSSINSALGSPLGISVTRITQVNGTIQIRVVVTGTGNGTCLLKIVHAGEPTVTASALVEAAATGSTCGGFDIPVSSLPAAGGWQASIAVVAARHQATTTATISVNKSG